MVLGVLFRVHKFLDVDDRIENHVYNAYYQVYAVDVDGSVLEQYCKSNVKSTRQVFSEIRSIKGKLYNIWIILKTVYVFLRGCLS